MSSQKCPILFNRVSARLQLILQKNRETLLLSWTKSTFLILPRLETLKAWPHATSLKTLDSARSCSTHFSPRETIGFSQRTTQATRSSTLVNLSWLEPFVSNYYGSYREHHSLQGHRLLWLSRPKLTKLFNQSYQILIWDHS